MFENKNINFGAFTNNFGFVGNNNQLKIGFKLSEIKINNDISQFILYVENKNDFDVQINSLMVAEFEIKDFKLLQVLENGWVQSSASVFKKKMRPSKPSKQFLARDWNPFSFDKNYGYIKNATVSEWYTCIDSNAYSLTIGAITTSNQYTQIYLTPSKTGVFVRVTCQLDGYKLKPNEKVNSETIAVIKASKEKSLELFAEILEKELPPALPTPIMKGLCCSYYYQGNVVDEEYVLKQIETFDKYQGRINLNCIQIDAGYCEWGDWLDYKNKFPNGLKNVADEIKKRNLKAGIWIAPFVASPKSKLFKNHPGWFLKDSKGKHFQARFTSPMDFLPALSLRVLDISQNEVQEYISTVIKSLVNEGFEYIKTDFTYPFGRITNYKNPMTRAQALNTGMKVIKKAAGENVLLQSSISQLSPLVGVIDYARVGLDSINPFVCKIPILRNLVNTYMLNSDLRNCQSREFLNKKVWINDADCFVGRKNTGLSKQMVRRHFDYIKQHASGTIWIGDNLAMLDSNIIEDLIIPLLN